mgnify:CR=1 FL=1
MREHGKGLVGEPVVYLWGETGTGKTHLLTAWAVATGAWRGSPLPEPPAAWVGVDDVDHLNADDQIRLFNLINGARDGQGRLLVTGPLPPGQLGLRQDLATRLAQGLVYRLTPLSDADKMAAIHTRAAGRGMPLPDEVPRHLLTHCRRDLPSLLALVDALDVHSLSRKRPASLPLLKELLLSTRA